MSASAAAVESFVFLDHFSDLEDQRQLGKVVYPLEDILLLSLVAVLAGAATFTGIAEFGKEKLDLLRRPRALASVTDPASPESPWLAPEATPPNGTRPWNVSVPAHLLALANHV